MSFLAGSISGLTRFLAIAARLRSETTLPSKWIAARVQIGTAHGGFKNLQNRSRRRQSAHFSSIIGVLAPTAVGGYDFLNPPWARPKGPSPCSLNWLRAKTNAKPQEPSNHAPSSNSNPDPFRDRAAAMNC